MSVVGITDTIVPVAEPLVLPHQVLEWGTAWLSQSDSTSVAAAPDVALSVALARCNTAAAAVAEGDSGALRAFQELEAAAQLLGTHGVAPALVAEIQGAIEVCLAMGPSNEVPTSDWALSSSFTLRYIYRVFLSMSSIAVDKRYFSSPWITVPFAT